MIEITFSIGMFHCYYIVTYRVVNCLNHSYLSNELQLLRPVFRDDMSFLHTNCPELIRYKADGMYFCSFVFARLQFYDKTEISHSILYCDDNDDGNTNVLSELKTETNKITRQT